jgi:hypothetical protein
VSGPGLDRFLGVATRRRLTRTALVALAGPLGIALLFAALGRFESAGPMLDRLALGVVVTPGVVVADALLLGETRYGRAWSAVSAAVGYLLVVVVGSLALVAGGAAGDYGLRIFYALLVVFSPVAVVVTLAGALVPNRP